MKTLFLYEKIFDIFIKLTVSNKNTEITFIGVCQESLTFS
jgi:hypothetical protein